MRTERVDTVVIGGGQAGLAVGYSLTKYGRDFVILEAGQRIGESWRRRWDLLHLFTPASFNHLPGMPFPTRSDHFASKDEMADYLESYAARFRLPVQLGVRVNELLRAGGHYLIATDGRRLEANHVVIATGAYSTPRVPTFAGQLDPSITQLHSVAYRSPAQLRDGAVLIVGAGNSGAEIALDLAPGHRVWLAGRDTGHLPITFGGFGYQVGGFIFRTVMKLLTVDTLPGRRIVTRAQQWSGGHPLIRIKPKDLIDAGVQRVSRVAGVSGGQPLLEDGRVLEVENVVWCTGFVQDYSWIRLPIFDAKGDPIQHRGVVQAEPGLYFTGLPFQSSLLSGIVAGAGEDAQYIVRQITTRANSSLPRPVLALPG